MVKIKKQVCKKLTAKNYKKCGFDNYYKIGKRLKFTKDTKNNTEKIYSSSGKYEGEMS